MNLSHFLKKFSGVAIYIDTEIEILENELIQLKSEMKNLINEKTIVLNTIKEVEDKEKFYLKEIIDSILKTQKITFINSILKEKIKNKHLQKNINQLEIDMNKFKEYLKYIYDDQKKYKIAFECYEEMKTHLDSLKEKEYKKSNFNKYFEKNNVERVEININQYNEIDLIKLQKEERLKLKLLYRETARLCHPDMMINKDKDKATDIMKMLNEAYSRKDIDTIKEILVSLEIGLDITVVFKPEYSKEILKQKIKEYSIDVEKIKDEVLKLKEHESYQKSLEYNNLDFYFQNLLKDFEVEKERIEFIYIESQKELDSFQN